MFESKKNKARKGPCLRHSNRCLSHQRCGENLILHLTSDLHLTTARRPSKPRHAEHDHAAGSGFGGRVWVRIATAADGEGAAVGDFTDAHCARGPIYLFVDYEHAVSSVVEDGLPRRRVRQRNRRKVKVQRTVTKYPATRAAILVAQDTESHYSGVGTPKVSRCEHPIPLQCRWGATRTDRDRHRRRGHTGSGLGTHL